MTVEGNSRKDVTNRIDQGKQAKQKLNRMLRSNRIRDGIKVLMHRAVVQSTLIF